MAVTYGYARCSTDETRQDIDRQKRELLAMGVSEDKYIYWEYESGAKTDRPELQKLIDIVREGDTICATEVSRLTRSTKHLCEILQTVQDKKLRILIGSFYTLMIGVMMMAVDVVGMLLLAVHGHGDVGAGDAALLRRAALKAHAGQAQGVHAGGEGVGVGHEFGEGGHQHIAGGAHAAFDVECFHGSIPFIWLIRLARKPAPKPLSMFTTLMPLAQELSMDSSAESPPKLAP